MKKFLFYALLLASVACRKEDDEVLLSQGNFYATAVIVESPIRGFSRNGEIEAAEVIRIIAERGEYMPDWRKAFVEVEFHRDTIQIFSSYAKMNIFGLALPYDYTINDRLISLEAQDTVKATFAFSEYQVQFFNKLNQYPLPKFEQEFVTTVGGFYTLTKFLDKRYIHVVDENTIQVPCVRYWNLVYNLDVTSGWWNPRQFNNRFKESGVGIINEKDTLLVKEFQIEYKRK